MQMVLENPCYFVSQVSVASDCAGYPHILTTLCQKSQESPKTSHELLSLQPSLIILQRQPLNVQVKKLTFFKRCQIFLKKEMTTDTISFKGFQRLHIYVNLIKSAKIIIIDLDKGQ